MENIKEERVFYYIKRAQHVLKKLNQPLDNYTYFITHFDTVITFLQNTKKTNSNICFYCSAILSVIRYTDTISDADKQKYRKKYLNINLNLNYNIIKIIKQIDGKYQKLFEFKNF